ncbi:hypothetical protein E7681_09165 [Thalassobius vesicularis]|uniref:Ferrochelatase n=1 Tax=Thalassobius vesicularis TaxID=1294297 RepID=A0A4S3MB98_9RHOB|nr:hypothetical protein [Thalassobius vesicularis]THD73776.1 hypothetical protein E7681_09165 [Thalassobius vesicularis]
MKRILLSAALAGLFLSNGPVLADGSSTVSPTIITPEIIEHDTASSSVTGIILPAVLVVLLVGAALR